MEADQLAFDYILRPGASTTNALRIMETIIPAQTGIRGRIQYLDPKSLSRPWMASRDTPGKAELVSREICHERGAGLKITVQQRHEHAANHILQAIPVAALQAQNSSTVQPDATADEGTSA